MTARQALPLTLPPGNTVRDFQVPLQKKGAFTATVRWNNQLIPVADAMFACIGRYRGPATIHPAETFCVSVDGESTFERFRGETRGGYVVRGASFEERFRMLGLMGCRLIRDWGGMYLTEWVNLEPEEGRFDFRVFDRCVNLIRQNGMEILPVFGRMYENWAPGQPEFRPEWLKKKLIRIEKNPPGTDPKFVVKVPPMPIWRRYVEAIVKHAGKRISIYEIMNEPNLNMSPELYMQYMVPAAEIIRKEAPHATILGICATGDMNGRLGEYVQACTKLGALNYLDGVSFHPYDARQLSSITPADVQIAELRKITGNKPLYNTELYFLYDWPDVTDKFQQYRHVKAHHAACRFLIDLGEGLKQGISIVEKTLWQDPLHPLLPFHELCHRPDSLRGIRRVQCSGAALRRGQTREETPAVAGCDRLCLSQGRQTDCGPLELHRETGHHRRSHAVPDHGSLRQSGNSRSEGRSANLPSTSPPAHVPKRSFSLNWNRSSSGFVTPPPARLPDWSATSSM
ncbi:MAG: beta-galactosidase [Lentisphaeria bacterium]|nr:MAG: beta-galactosidase [Lentisphaeria bacterium]